MSDLNKVIHQWYKMANVFITVKRKNSHNIAPAIIKCFTDKLYQVNDITPINHLLKILPSKNFLSFVVISNCGTPISVGYLRTNSN